MDDSKPLEDSKGDMHNMIENVWIKIERTEDENPTQQVIIKAEPLNEVPGYVKEEPVDEEAEYFGNEPIKRDGTVAITNLADQSSMKPFKCELCFYETKTLPSLERHMILHKKENGEPTSLYKCDLCSYQTCEKSDLSNHKNMHKKSKKFKCDKCSFETIHRNSIKKHKSIHNDRDCYKCDKCSFTTKYEGHMTRHLSQIHKEYKKSMNKCGFCDFATLVKWRLKKHLIKSKQDKVLKCVICNYQTVYLCQLRSHKSNHKEDAKDTVVNENSITSKSNQESDDFDVEMPIEEKIYFYDPKKAEIAWKNIPVIENNSSKPFKCTECDFTSKLKASVQRHYVRLHTGNSHMPFVCTKCNFHTKTRDQISLHNKRSVSSILLNCKMCRYKTHYKCELLIHQKGHNLFKCADCDYISKNKYDLRKHSAVHAGFTYKCEHCEYNTVRKDALYSHMTVHTGIKPYKCTECNYQAIRKSTIAKHVRKRHCHKQLSDSKNYVENNKCV